MGGGHWGGAKILQNIMVHTLSVTKMNKYCGVGGGGGGGMRGRQNSTKYNGVPSLCH